MSTSGKSVLIAVPMPEEWPRLLIPRHPCVFLFVCGPAMVVEVLRTCDAMCQAMFDPVFRSREAKRDEVFFNGNVLGWDAVLVVKELVVSFFVLPRRRPSNESNFLKIALWRVRADQKRERGQQRTKYRALTANQIAQTITRHENRPPT